MTPIRIAHISDTHLGYRSLSRQDSVSGRNQRTIDVDLAFERAIDSILAQRPDAIIHGGDVFHHSRPTWQSLRHFIRQMRRIETARIPTLVIAGNHDTPRIRTGGSAYSVLELALPDIRFVADYQDVHENNVFRDLNLHVQAIPHGALTNPDPVVSMAKSGVRNVLVCHGMVPGILKPGVHTEPGELELGQNLVNPAGFDYVALGHYHLHLRASPRAWYSGSTERFGWGDVDATPGYALLTLGDLDTEPSVEHVPIESRPMVNLKPVFGDNLRAQDIAGSILKGLAAINDQTAMARAELRDADRNTRREVERLLRRETDAFVWSFSLAADRPVFSPAVESSARSDMALDLQTLFSGFVAERKGAPYTAGFATAFLERGSRALTDAIVAQATPAPEEEGAA